MEIVKLKCINKEYSQVDFDFNKKIIDIVKSIGGAFFANDDKKWYIKNLNVKYLLPKLKQEGVAVRVDKIIQKHLNLSPNGKTSEEVAEFKKYKKEHSSYAVYSDYNTDYLGFKEGMDLYSYQKAGLEYGISKGGRVLIADDMGLGKTAQAIALTSHYKNDWPIVIAAPASLLLNWKKELLMWLNFLNEDDITIVKNKNHEPNGLITICSYDYCFKKQESLSQYVGVKGILIVDEAHAMKNWETNRGKALIKFSHAVKRVIMISGTPFLSRPCEIWSILYAINPLHEKWKDFETFAYRYCEGKLIKINKRMIFDYSGASRMEELHYLLRDELMVRRLNTDENVLDQLPEKRRLTQYLEPDKKYSKDLDLLISSLETTVKEYYPKYKNDLHELKRAILKEQSEIEDSIFKAYKLSGESKVHTVCDWVEEKFDDGMDKLIIFGHHEDFLNAIQDILEKKSINFMRIDGKVSKEKRFENTERFQNVPECRVALLSIGAGSVGLTLTAAHNVLVAEMPWTPALAQQAEARAHRNGQKELVNCYYAIANGTLDGYLWNMLSKKSSTSSLILDGGLGDEMQETIDVSTNDILDAVILSVVENFNKEKNVA